MEQAPDSHIQVSRPFAYIPRMSLMSNPQRSNGLWQITYSSPSNSPIPPSLVVSTPQSSFLFRYPEGPKVASQITALHGAFGRAKTQANPDATRYSSYTELRFSFSTFSSADAAPGGAVVGARVLAWGLDKSRLTRLRQDERTSHIFYQLLSGATPGVARLSPVGRRE